MESNSLANCLENNNHTEEAIINEYHVVSDFVDVVASPLMLSNHWKKPRLPE
jgi:hypothetical protein